MKYAVCPHCLKTAPIPGPTRGPSEKSFAYTATLAVQAINLLEAVFENLPASVAFEYLPEGALDQYASLMRLSNGRE